MLSALRVLPPQAQSKGEALCGSLMSAEQENAHWAEPGSGPPPLHAFKVEMEGAALDVNQSYIGPAQYLQRLG